MTTYCRPTWGGDVPDSFEALAVIFFAVLPGAIFVYAVERQVGAWGVKASDRVLRFVVLSAAFYVLWLPYGYILYRSYILNHDLLDRGHFPFWHWVVLTIHYVGVLAYFGVLPWVLGTICGRQIKKGNEVVGEMFGHTMRPPRAFDYLFRDDKLAGYVRMLVLLPDKASWVAGCFTDEGNGRRAYVSGYPENPPDIYLPIRLRCDATTGAFLRDTQGQLIADNIGVLVSGEKIAYLEFIDG
jgi:hypothetical protein